MHQCLVTGVNGFVGQHLARELHQAGVKVIGVSREPELAPEIDSVVSKYYGGDLTDPAFIKILPLKPLTSLINLAGIARMNDDSIDPSLYSKVNTDVTKMLADRALAAGNNKLRFVAISSGQVYDSSKLPPFNEQATLIAPKNRNSYVASKVALEEVMKSYQADGHDYVVARPFNHIGPGQLPGFLVPDLARQLQEALRHHKNYIEVGDLSNKRDFTDVRDVVRAYRLLAFAKPAQLKNPIYNICSGKALRGQQILDLLMKHMGVSHMSVRIDQSRLRPNDPPILFGDYSAIKKDVGWRPTIPLPQTIHDFVAKLN